MAIPKIIHQTWKEAKIPEAYRTYVDQLKTRHPDWEYRLWTDADAAAFVAREYPGFLPIYRAMPRNIMRADVIRYLVLRTMGGIYLDLDYEVYRPFDDLVEAHRLILPKNRDESEPCMGGQWHLGNAIMASEASHPFWDDVFADLTDDPPTLERVGRQPDVEALTGPRFLTRVARERSLTDGAGGVWLAPRKLFHGLLPHHPGREGVPPSEDAYGAHHCSGTWRPPPGRPSLLRRIIRRGLGRWKRILPPLRSL